ncbi:hypothetical protein C0995_000102 [Termitomyces sp. Mi166|nr:hypothetical protein C0995_000102 [Termitomyces sp. Mi166\
MFSKSTVILFVLSILAASQPTLARERWLERDGRAIRFHPRRFGQEHPGVIDKLSAACPGEVCGNLAGQAITPLLAAQPECSQQDMADAIIDASRQFDATTQANMIALAIEYRRAEKNTPPYLYAVLKDFSVNPPALRNSVFCQKASKNPELNGLVQAQDPDNDPNLFFDPATKVTVKKGDQPNTFSFGGNNTTVSATISPIGTVALTVSSACDPLCRGTTNAAATPTPLSGSISNFGKCSVPQIEFGVGFDGRKETSFQPVDKTSYNHGSAQNVDIITRTRFSSTLPACYEDKHLEFICDTLVNSCGADATARATCASAKAAADAAAAKTGAQADKFNAVFGIKTAFTTAAAVVTTTSSNIFNLQTFTQALGDVSAPSVTAFGNGQFQVEGNAIFNDELSALNRSCDVQNNKCADAANALGNQNGFTVAVCNAQQQSCLQNASKSA